MLKRYIVILWT